MVSSSYGLGCETITFGTLCWSATSAALASGLAAKAIGTGSFELYARLRFAPSVFAKVKKKRYSVLEFAAGAGSEPMNALAM
jgi:hypothetical protein